MTTQDFGEFLEKKELSEEKIGTFTKIGEMFEDFLKGAGHLEAPTAADVDAFSLTLIKEGINEWDNYYALAYYGRYRNNDQVYVEAIALIDGAEAMERLHKKVGEELGKEKQEEIFADIEIPPLGSPNAVKPKVTQIVMERLEDVVGEEGVQELLGDCLRYLEDAWFADAREKYLACKNFDEFLQKKGDDFIAELTKLKNEGQVFFNQKITDEVIAYVESRPEIRQGLREGNILYEAKIPHQTIEYLAEKDAAKKRYHYCHCPWAKESLQGTVVKVPPSFCNCSAGFHKKYWEVVLDQPLKAEVLETVLDGDLWCRFAIHLPEGI